MATQSALIFHQLTQLQYFFSEFFKNFVNNE